VSNVQFTYSGQEGYVDKSDPRYSIAYLDTGAANDIKPSYVKNSAFSNGFSPAIGLYGADNVTIEGNVIHSTVWYGKSSA